MTCHAKRVGMGGAIIICTANIHAHAEVNWIVHFVSISINNTIVRAAWTYPWPGGEGGHTRGASKVACWWLGFHHKTKTSTQYFRSLVMHSAALVHVLYRSTVLYPTWCSIACLYAKGTQLYKVSFVFCIACSYTKEDNCEWHSPEVSWPCLLNWAREGRVSEHIRFCSRVDQLGC